MPADDAQRVWFPEMIDDLRAQWREGMPWSALIELRDHLDAMLQQIRAERHIRPPVITCSKCGYVGPSGEPHVTVRAMILSLLRFEIAPAEPVYALEKAWARYRKQNSLDPSGEAIAPAADGAAGCAHLTSH